MHHLPPWPVPTNTWEAPTVLTSMHTDPTNMLAVLSQVKTTEYIRLV